MNKTFSKSEIAIIKRTAANAAPFVAKKEKIEAEIAKLEASRQEMIDQIVASAAQKVDAKIASKKERLEMDKKTQQDIIDTMQGYVVKLTGYTTEDLVTRETIHTGKIDAKTGKELLQTRFVLKYPETVIPETPAVGTIEAELPTTAEGPGSDYDIDKENYPEEMQKEYAETAEIAAAADPFDGAVFGEVENSNW